MFHLTRNVSTIFKIVSFSLYAPVEVIIGLGVKLKKDYIRNYN